MAEPQAPAGTGSQFVTFRLLAEGQKACKNDVIASLSPTATQLVFYLPGDIQNFAAEMKEYQDYSLENTVAKLQRHFGAEKSAIIVVRAERIVDSYSHFDYFLRPGMCTLHTLAIINSVFMFYKREHNVDLPTDLPIHLCGFSKGSLVLNSFMSEYATFLALEGQQPGLTGGPKTMLDWQGSTNDKPLFKYPLHEPCLKIQMSQTPVTFFRSQAAILGPFLHRVTAIHWLDGHRFPSNPGVIASIADLLTVGKLRIFLSGTPRQLQDKRSVYTKQEHEAFVGDLAKFAPGCVESGGLVNVLFFPDEDKSLEQHFRLLDVF